MKKPVIWIIFEPLYVPLASLIGFVFVLCLYVWFYPHADAIGQAFEATPQFWVWIFILAIEAMFYTVVLIPCWMQFIDFLKEQFISKDIKQRIGIIIMLILSTIILLLFLGTIEAVIKFMRKSAIIIFPEGYDWRYWIFSLYAFIAVLPNLLIMLLIYNAVHFKSGEIEQATSETAMFEIAHSLLGYRSLLQTSLLILGVIVSLFPVATAALRSILVAIGQANENIYPMTLIAVYGLFYTVLLIIFYAPVHLILSETSRKLRDKMCSLGNSISLEENLKKKIALDEWLQTNIGLSQNLKTGIITLSPLITSLVLSLFGPTMKLP
jgi:hypothetical protein